MELKLGADTRYHLYSPPKNTALDAGHKKAKPRSLEQLVEEINTRFSSQNAEQGKLAASEIKTGLQQLEKEQEQEAENAPSLEELLAAVAGNKKDSAKLEEQMVTTYELLDSLKGCANTIAKYEKLAADDSLSEEERTFYKESLESMHKNFDEAFEFGRRQISFLILGGTSSKQILNSLGIQDFKGMDSAQILEKIDAAQKKLEQQGISSQNKDSTFAFHVSGFEANSTMHLKNADKYGCMPTSLYDSRWKIGYEGYVGTIRQGQKGFWLDTTA